MSNKKSGILQELITERRVLEETLVNCCSQEETRHFFKKVKAKLRDVDQAIGCMVQLLAVKQEKADLTESLSYLKKYKGGKGGNIEFSPEILEIEKNLLPKLTKCEEEALYNLSIITL